MLPDQVYGENPSKMDTTPVFTIRLIAIQLLCINKNLNYCVKWILKQHNDAAYYKLLIYYYINILLW